MIYLLFLLSLMSSVYSKIHIVDIAMEIPIEIECPCMINYNITVLNNGMMSFYLFDKNSNEIIFSKSHIKNIEIRDLVLRKKNYYITVVNLSKEELIIQVDSSNFNYYDFQPEIVKLVIFILLYWTFGFYFLTRYYQYNFKLSRERFHMKKYV